MSQEDVVSLCSAVVFGQKREWPLAIGYTLATPDDVVEAGGSEKTKEEALAGETEEEMGLGTVKAEEEEEKEEAAAIDKAEEEAGPAHENDKEESPASDRAEQEDKPAPKVDGTDDESLWSIVSLCGSNHEESDTDLVAESTDCRQDEEAAESCFGRKGSCCRSLRICLSSASLARIIPRWPHNRVHLATEPDKDTVEPDSVHSATPDDVVEAGGSEKTKEEALAGETEEEMGLGTVKAEEEEEKEEAAAIDKAEEEAGPAHENDKEESPASDRAEQEDKPAPKVDGTDDESYSTGTP
ncbi:uncharacterized protein LOC102166270 isoform X2 [Sus scrofa]|uniref:uncharacterized protein LOC102166270 isoform X2 n=1 Tax=Sus scrofa TaxID=9823 RepID=UPI000A2B42E7|nr:uncharacterized protein LOC102166270 isoform X2 [Sus scrofa]